MKSTPSSSNENPLLTLPSATAGERGAPPLLLLCFYGTIIAILAGPPAYAGGLSDTEIIGRAKLETALENGSGRLQKNEQNLDLEARSSIGDNASLKAIFRVQHETRMQQDNLSDADLREFYLDYFGESYRLRLGRQQVVWGKTDGLRLLDIINPQDFREFILDDFIDSRIPLWMARGDLYVGDDTLQILVIPDVRSNKPAGPGDRFEPAYLKGIRAIPGLHIDDGEPAVSISNSELGLRYSGFAKGWDYSLNLFYGWDDNPIFFNETSVARRYRRLATAGGAVSNAFGSFVLRGEAALNLDRNFTTTSASRPSGQIERDEAKLAFGIDYTTGDWLISGQVFESAIMDYEEGIAYEEFTTLLSLLLNAKFINETLELKLMIISGLNDSDSMSRSSATYSITDRWKVMGGLTLFNGPSDSFLGQFDDADRVEAELTYSF